jgi:hypothetical protein
LTKLKSKLMTEERKINQEQNPSVVRALSSRSTEEEWANKVKKLERKLKKCEERTSSSDSDECDLPKQKVKSKKNKTKPVFTCYTCGEVGHISADCPKRGQKKHKGRRLNNDEESLSAKYKHPGTTQASERAQQEQESDTGDATDSDSDAEQIFAATVAIRGKERKRRWLLDSGSTSHMCADKGKFEQLSSTTTSDARTAG